MNNKLISREWLEDAFDNLCCHDCKICRNFRIEDSFYKCALIDNAPTVDTEDLKPLVDKFLEVLPELTDAIIKELPKIVSGKIKCSECSYYTNTFNGEWVRKENPLGEQTVLN